MKMKKELKKIKKNAVVIHKILFFIKVNFIFLYFYYNNYNDNIRL